MKKISLVFVLSSLLFSCINKKVDASDPIRMKSTIEAIKKDLKGEKRQEFEDAFLFIIDYSFKNKDQIVAKDRYDSSHDFISKMIHEKTSDEIISLAKKLGKNKGDR